MSAEACVLMSADGTALYEKNAGARCLIASTTKLMTALLCLENADPDETVTAQERHCLVEGSSMYLRAGERYTVRELLLGLLLASGNDAALALAEHVAGSETAFVALMNQRAAALGLRDTHFENPHGLDAAGHYSTARDLARLMLRCMETPGFAALASARTAEAGGNVLCNHNKLLALCPGCLAGKTGYTRAAGRCLVSCCEREGLRLVCVTLSDPDDWNDHLSLYNWGYAAFRLFPAEGELSFSVPVVSGSRESVRAAPQPETRLLLPRLAETELRAELPRFVFAPVDAGERAGTLRLFCGGEAFAELPLVYLQSAVPAWPC